uniref:DNA-directed RNA polymerase III subunit RPC7 n=1 Tax=Rhizophora mucronata TaxID=61149 RepID=A0A2P2JF39_RHIMU
MERKWKKVKLRKKSWKKKWRKISVMTIITRLSSNILESYLLLFIIISFPADN